MQKEETEGRTKEYGRGNGQRKPGANGPEKFSQLVYSLQLSVAYHTELCHACCSS